MDIKMPVINGLEATSYIRKELHSEIPIIALTAKSLPVEISKTREAGMSDFVSKPIDPTLLYSKMLRHLGIVTDTQVKEPPSDIRTTLELYDLSTVKELSRGSDDFLNTTIELFLDKTPAIIVSIKEALTKHNLPEIKSQAHKLKSTANLFHMDQVVELIEKIEKFDEQTGSQNDLSSSIALLEKLVNDVKTSLINYR
jgi:CheY-like chemotaxis protein